MKISRKFYPYIIIGFLSFILNIILYLSGSYNFIESEFYNMKFKIRGPLNSYYDENKENSVVIVEIDDASYELINESYPYPRGTVYGNVVKNLTKANAKVIVFDIMFDSYDHTSKIIKKNLEDNCMNCTYQDQDDIFANSINYANKNGTDIVLAAKIAKDINRIPIDYLVKPNNFLMQEKPHIGLVNQGIDNNSLTNKKYVILSQLSEEPEKYYSSLALESYLLYNDYNVVEKIDKINNHTIQINDLLLNTIDNEASIAINYYGPVSNIFNTFSTFSLSEVIDTESYNLSNYEDDDWMDKYINPKNPLYSFFKDKNPFDNKVVIIGSSLEEDNDFVVSPFFNYKKIDSKMPGVELHANAIQQLIDSNYINISDLYSDINDKNFIAIIFIMFVIIYTLIISNAKSTIRSILVLLSTILIWFSISVGGFLNDQLWILKVVSNYMFSTNINFSYLIGDKIILLPVFYPIAALITTYGMNLSYKIFKEQNDKNFLKLTFGKYVSPKIIDMMYDNKKIPELGGESGIRTAYFSDIEAFSTISEKLSSKKLVDLLNEYLSAQTEIILDHNGTLDKYEGDSVIAFFGAPVFFENHSKKAIDAAIKCQNNLQLLNEKWKKEKEDWPEIIHSMKMRTGLNSGEMVTGNMGSKYNMNYTMIGDVVNTASRLESSAKQYGIFLHTTEETLNNAGKKNYIWRYIDRVIFVGKNIHVQTIEILGFNNDENNDLKDLADAFHKGLKEYYNRNWESAINNFQISDKYEKNQLDGRINPSKLYIQRANIYKDDEPDSSWCGITNLKQK